VSTQAPLQSLSFDAQDGWQDPPEQTEPAAQGASQPPQWAGCEPVSTQLPPQAVSGPQLQLPAMQLSLAAQAVLQSPQKRGSPSTSTQCPWQSSRLGEQEGLQAPPSQTSPAAQVRPQPPQLAGSSSSVAQSTQRPPAVQAQPPEMQTWPPTHSMKHSPQCSGSPNRSTHWLPQRPSAPQLTQSPASQISSGVQALSQRPQWLRSWEVSTQLPPQLCSFGSQGMPPPWAPELDVAPLPPAPPTALLAPA
jgi:hypothetical protein